jgi:menaquinol-cytochrome c reductase iron-sulfur subunit
MSILKPETPEEITRRTFMANATLTLTGITGLGLAIPIIGALTPKVDAGTMSWDELDSAGWKQLQESTDTPVMIDFTLDGKDAYLPEQKSPEAVWGIKVPDLGKFKKLRPDIYENPKGDPNYAAVNLGFAIFSPICPHLGCRYDYNPELNGFRCKCHGSTYDKVGAHLGGPATRGLDPLPMREQSGSARVTWIRYAPTIPDRIVVSYIN